MSERMNARVSRGRMPETEAAVGPEPELRRAMARERIRRAHAFEGATTMVIGMVRSLEVIPTDQWDGGALPSTAIIPVLAASPLC
jgi:hypothetical protein